MGISVLPAAVPAASGSATSATVSSRSESDGSSDYRAVATHPHPVAGQEVPETGAVRSTRYRVRIASRHGLPLRLAVWDASSTATRRAVPSSFVSDSAHANGVAGSPRVPTTSTG